MDETTSAAEDRTGSRHLSRRKVLKAAGHAAWVVPAIQVASMAPAFATSPSDTLTITAAGGQWTLGASDYVDVTIVIQNNSASLPANNVQLTLTFPNVYVYDDNDPPKDKTLSFSSVTVGWSDPPTVSYPGKKTNRTGLVVFTLNQLAAGTSTTLKFRVTTTRDMNSVAGGSTDTVTFGVTATGFPPVGGGSFDPA